ncbi:restriction endonuclease subunit S [Desulfuromonas acetexigens]|jgi:type I restriction enzyme S subunit|uniref:Restriction endonuclease subunit S n=1 Tax=Trichloromonas acetexigens TaxID=38815 RepID=A0A550JGC1_9BACT|nr:restriction endonuclease subunit S [Desulfuromonas acetexigens]TRO82259.1 restriction endonuclease subunit S [Desulfuromonas acetexigens]
MNNVPLGYKQTEVGVIPEDWDARLLGKVITLQRGYDLPCRLRKPGTVPIVTSSGIGETHSEPRVAGPGVVTGRYGTIGDVFYVCENFWPLNTTLYVRNFQGNDPRYVSYLLRTIDFHSHSGKSGVPGVNRNDLHEIVVLLPPTKAEQEAIAEALSDADALIESLEQLIAKKRQVKQGTMQELLTGKRRLPGFSGEWEVKRLGEVIEKFVGGGTPRRANPKYWGNEIPWVTVKDFATFSPRLSQEMITRVGLQNSASNLIPMGTLITSTRMALGKAVVYEVDVAINQDLKALFPIPELATQYLNFWFQYHGKDIDELGSGSTVKGVSLTDLKKIEFKLPPLPEQTAIAAILSDMDAEIAELEAKLAKARQVKQGMMQELLTGRIRLV